MALPIVWKKVGERRTFTFDFTEKLAAGDSLSGAATVTGTPTGLTIGTPARTGNRVDVQISSGSDATDYTLKCECGTAQADTLQLSATLEVRESVN